METKICIVCNKILPLVDFPKHKTAIDGRSNQCKEYRKIYKKAWLKKNPKEFRKYHLKRTFGLTIEDYAKMLKQQKGVCAICGKPETTIVKNILRNLVIGHCHKTEKIRGLLCGRCNRVIGLMQDSPTFLKAAADYLEQE